MNYEEPKLSDYALIGNCCTAALVSKFGSIDWFCLPEFHSPSVFAALLDREKGGYFSIQPCADYQSGQRYRDDTNVVETTFITSSGEVRLFDSFTAMKEEDEIDSLFPEHEIIRIAECVAGEVKMKVKFCPRILYGSTTTRLTDYHRMGIKVSWKENVLILISTLRDELTVDDRAESATGEFTLKAGEKIIFSLAYSGNGPAVIPEVRTTAIHRFNATINYWKTWLDSCRYSGIYQTQVRRSALTLKLLAHAPSGAIIAAPTTSLPEEAGGERNWDYRYCWLRDASFTTRALLKLGFEDEARAYMNWILHATRLTQPKLQVVYSVYGDSTLEEKTLDWLSGYKNSKPVRIGNKADSQFQLDVYGEVLDAIYSYAKITKEFDTFSIRFIIGLGNSICRLWHKPDNGIWEVRTPGVHHTHSKVMAWVGLDRLIKLCHKYQWKNAPVEYFRQTRASIADEIETRGFNRALNSYTRLLQGDTVDASLLTLPLVGFCEYNSSRWIPTLRMIRQQLGDGKMIYRYKNIDDGVRGSENSFAICNFWLAENLAQSGEIDEAIAVFEATLKCASPTGLLSEQINPRSRALFGNYPQGFTHIGLINAALSIDEVLQTKKALAS
jgi:GH15 family glucan-1,4-alpha-glucosidase